MVSKKTAQLPSILAGAHEEGFDKLATWDDKKKEQFCQTFEQRTKFAQAAIEATAEILFREAKARYFVPITRSQPEFSSDISMSNFEIDWAGSKIKELKLGVHVPTSDGRHSYDPANTRFKRATGRTVEELAEVVKDRVENLIQELPASLDVVKVIRPNTAKDMGDLATLEKRYSDAKDRVNELAQPVDLNDFLGQGILLDDFIKQAKQRQSSKRRWAVKVGEMCRDVSSLRGRINKALYKGIPELDKATMATIEELREQCFALDKLNRKVDETVKYGDSDAAMKALDQFEKDEVDLAPAIEARFKGLISTLRQKYNLKAGKRPKATAGQKRARRKKKIKVNRR